MAKKIVTKAQKDKKPAQTGVFHAHLVRPRITEKASMHAMNANVYMFEVGKDTTKLQVKKAILEAYKVAAIKVNMSPIRGKKMLSRGKWGETAHKKKAYVFLKKGDKIEFV